jgi:predicted nucleic acid-binding protein
LVLPFDAKAAWKYAAIRRDRSLRAPDAVQLACAASTGIDLFVTNDRRLQGKHVDGIQFIVALEQVPI